MPDIYAKFEMLKIVEVTTIDKWVINDEPELMIGSAVARTKKSRKVHVLLVNNTN